MKVFAGAPLSLSWSTQHAVSCIAAGEWSGTKPLFGVETHPGLTEQGQFIFSLSCVNDTGKTTKAVTVQVKEEPAPTPDPQPTPSIHDESVTQAITQAGDINLALQVAGDAHISQSEVQTVDGSVKSTVKEAPKHKTVVKEPVVKEAAATKTVPVTAPTGFGGLAGGAVALASGIAAAGAFTVRRFF